MLIFSVNFFEIDKTPSVIKWLTSFFLAIGILAPIVSYLLHHFNLLGPSELFPLSIWGIKKGFIWQFFSYLFIQAGGFTLSSLIGLFFNLLILWMSGSLLIREYSIKHFLVLFFGSGVFAGFIATILMAFLPYPVYLAGLSPAIYALLFTIAMLLPDLQLAFFFIVRLKIKWVIFILIGFSLLTSLFSGSWVFLISELSGIFFAYIYGACVLKLRSPFPFTHPFDRLMHRYCNFTFYKKKSDKIIHFEDETFLDRMLDKISKKGKESLTRSELRRMKNISKRKKK